MVANTLDKYRSMLATPMSAEIAKFCNPSVGMEVFTMNMAYEMSLSACFEFWGALIKGINDFMSSLVPDTRHFDMNLWMSPHSIQPRTRESVGNLFYPSRGGVATSNTPVIGTKRSAEFLATLTDAEFREVYNRAILREALRYHMMSKLEFQQFAKLHILAFRSVMEHQVLRWIIPSPKLAKNRNSPKTDIGAVLRVDFFEKQHFSAPQTAANNLVSMVAKAVLDDVRQFSPKLKPSYDNYPTVVVRDPSTDKEREIQDSEYVKRFKSNWAWFSLAKMVARFAHYELKDAFMLPFNIPTYQCFKMEDTTIPEDVLHGIVSVVAHGEVVANPFLQGNTSFSARLDKEFRRVLVFAADVEMSSAIRESRHEIYSADDQDHIMREHEKFKRLAQAYKRPRPGPTSTTRRPPYDDDNDDDDSNGGGPRGSKPRGWNLASLTHREKETMRQIPAPTRDGQGPQDDDVHMEEVYGVDSDVDMAYESDDEGPWLLRSSPISADGYIKRFRRNWSWFNLAEMVARYTHYQMSAEFMLNFNNPTFQCFIGEDTSIPEDVVHGVVSAYAHSEVLKNPVLCNNKAFFATLLRSFRRTVVLAADKEMATAARERRYEDSTAEEKDLVCRERDKFRRLAETYKPRGDRGGGGASRHDDNDDDDDENGGGGPGGSGPKTWDLARLTHSEQKTIERFPVPARRGHDVQDQDVEMTDKTDEEALDEVDEAADTSDTESLLHIVGSDTILQVIGWSMRVAGGRSEKAVGSFGGFGNGRRSGETEVNPGSQHGAYGPYAGSA